MNLRTLQEEHARKLLPCCPTALGLSPDARKLLLGSEDLDRGWLSVYDAFTLLELYAVYWITGSPELFFFDGDRTIVVSRHREPHPDRIIATIVQGRSNVKALNIPSDFGERPTRLALSDFVVYVGASSTLPTPTPTPTGTRTPTPATPAAPTGGGHGGCTASRAPSGHACLLLGPALLLVFVRKRRLLVLAILFSATSAPPAAAKVIADGATMRIDLGALQPALQPNGPATARPVPPGMGGMGGTAAAGIGCEVMNVVQTLGGTTAPAVTYEMEIALDLQRDWRPWFNDDVQLLINYMAGTFEALNGTLLRDASVRVVITHMQIWYDMAPPPQFNGLGIKDYWEANWPRCITPGNPANCIHRDAAIILSFGSAASGGSAWIGLPCTGNAYAWVTWGPSMTSRSATRGRQLVTRCT